MSSLEILALIPARGGSKGIPRKNLLPIGGKPLIVHSIETALASRRITREDRLAGAAGAADHMAHVCHAAAGAYPR